MADGAAENGDDLVVGRTNFSDQRTILVADEHPGGYENDFVLHVGSRNNSLQVLTPPGDGIDAIHGVGTIASGVIPAGSGVVGIGLNGLVGYVHDPTGLAPPAFPARRNKSLERAAIPAGVVGVGDGADGTSNGVFGQGLNGVVGYQGTTPRDFALERATDPAGAVPAGVLGVGIGVGGGVSNGVFGKGMNGVVGYGRATARDIGLEMQIRAGVFGRSDIGVFGDGLAGAGVRGRGKPGVHGEGSDTGPGVSAECTKGPGVRAFSEQDRAGIFETKGKIAQVWLIPLAHNIPDPGQLPLSTAGELLVLNDELEDGTVVTTLWFCTIGGGPGQSNWVKLA
jgi:hypothetical protein